MMASFPGAIHTTATEISLQKRICVVVANLGRVTRSDPIQVINRSTDTWDHSDFEHFDLPTSYSAAQLYIIERQSTTR
jgi:hypothetical protein